MTATVTTAEPPTPTPNQGTARVRVWFGKHLIIDWEGDADKAPWMAKSIQRRYPSLKVKITKANGNDW